MILRNLPVCLVSSLLLLSISASPVLAQTPPTFPVCSNPQGTLTVKHDTGVHGVAGDPNAYTGTDSVYSVDDDQVLQCLCPASGNGIQTNWWKIEEMSQEEINTYINLGWNFIPDGSVWGLQQGAYLAFNTTYSCGGSNGGGGNNNNDGGTGGGSTQGASTGPAVLGLASTGNSAFLYALFALGVSSTLLGYSLKRSK